MLPQPPQSTRQLSGTLTREPTEIKRVFRSLAHPKDVAELLEIEWSQLYYITHRAPNRYPYRRFEIPKKAGGRRIIQAPHSTVKILQRKLLEVLDLVYKAHPAAHGFIRDRSISSNAASHVGKRLILNLDIQDFFPSITFPRVRGIFIKRFRIPPDPATVLARICCNTGDEPDHIAQGAPTSPIISNMICHAMDHQFVALARANGLFYTRYADDITFSTNRKAFPLALAEMHEGSITSIGSWIKDVLQDNGFTLNDRKTRAYSSASRQEVTGLTVNTRINLQRKFYRQIRSMLHAWKEHGHDAAQTEYNNKFDAYAKHAPFRLVIAGKLAYLRQIRTVDDRIFRRLYGWARYLDPNLFLELPAITDRAQSLRLAVGKFPAITSSDDKPLRRQYLRQMFASCTGILWVVDPDLKIEPVKDLEDVVTAGKVSEIRLLSRSKPIAKQAQEFVEIRRRLKMADVSIEWHVLSSRAFHDRWLADDSDCVSIGGPFASIYDPRPPYGQNQIVPRPDQFEAWWTSGLVFYDS